LLRKTRPSFSIRSISSSATSRRRTGQSSAGGDEEKLICGWLKNKNPFLNFTASVRQVRRRAMGFAVFALFAGQLSHWVERCPVTGQLPDCRR
jgi:hypothetical protein